MNRTARRIVLWGILALLLIAGLAVAFWPRAVPVDLAPVARGPLQVTVDEEGETRVREVYVVSAPIAGRLLRIELDVGDPVTAGETVVASIRPRDPTLLDLRSQREAEAAAKAAEAALTLAATELERSRAELRFAETELVRAQRLAERGNISDRELDAARLEVRTGKAAVAAAEAAIKVKRFDLETARAQLISPNSPGPEGDEACCVELRAPVSGRVLKILRESETVVAAGEPLVEIGDPRDLEIVADLLSGDAVAVEPGAPVLIEEWGGGDVLKGRVKRIEPTGFTKVSALGIEEQRVNVIVDFASPPEAWERLGHGYRVELRVVIWQGADVLQVPLGALFRDGGAWSVFVASDGRAARRKVDIGRRNSAAAEVIAGLDQGERVILHPSDRVTDGARIAERAR